MTGFSKLAFVETKLFLREKAATLAVFALPVALVIGFGLIPGFGKPQKGLSDQIGTEYIAAIGVAIVLATLGLNGVPMVIAQYRERGILRRLAVTPVRPLTLLIAKLTVWVAAAVLSVAIVVAVVRLAFHVPAPVAPGWFVASLILGIASLFAVGMLVAAVAPNARTATGIGMVPDSGFESLETRYETIERFLPFLLLTVPLIPYVLSQGPSAGAVGITVGVTVAAAIWIMWMVTLHPGWADRTWVRWTYFPGLVAFIGVLTIRSPWFAFFTWMGFLHGFRFLSGVWRWVGCAVIVVFFGMSQSGGFHRPTVSTVAIWILVACVDLVLVGAFTLLGVKTEEQNQARKGMIVELAEANQRLEEMIAENTGLQAQLLVQAREAGTGDERQRMAREIHDTLAQGLTGIITQLEAAQQTGHDAERERRIGNAKGLARDSLAEARRSVQALRPQALENSRLPEALAGEVARWSATSGVAGEVETTGDARPLHPEVEVTLLRVAQEALANVAKHARASRAGVTLSYMEDVVTLDVRDDGTGFAAPQPTALQFAAAQLTVPRPAANGLPPADGGFGLIAMRQRVTRLAGQLEIESEPGAGTAVSASLPAISLARRASHPEAKSPTMRR